MTEPRSVLIVEDESLIAMMLEDFLDSLGHSLAGTCDTVPEALARVEQGGFDVAILDVNLNGQRVWPVADRLAAKGIPYILATGGHIEPPPPEHAAAPVLSKPFTLDAIEPALAAALGG
ncbi:MAG: response regulator [Alphaproteobacteria bacterium]|nr:response regulator [Alphaproteobacteria bacterium]